MIKFKIQEIWELLLELPMQLVALGAGGCTTAAVFLLAAWPLGLGEELKRVRGTI